MKKVTLLFISFITLSVSVAKGNDALTAFANLHQIDGSKIKASIVLLETETGITVTGVASGLDPNTPYGSLAYDLGSVPAGPNACLPTASAPGFLGFWDVKPDGTGTLNATTGGFGVNDIAAVSIRIFNAAGPRPLQACGRVHVQGL